MSLAAEPKSLLRQRALARRGSLDPQTRALLTARLVEEGLACARQWRARIVSAFSPIRDEPDALGLLCALGAEGFATALPVTVSRGAPLIFRLWRPGDVLVTERFSTMRPTGEVLAPDFLLVPLLAFDRR
ncbi:MAG TPA: 5-formyltetrahydrofolate cyclo-ligase, partial [Roseiarcus sp.]|nr:5-formyltetrahydrofolate cyclo-ligase [Roseiarcus sp.]